MLAILFHSRMPDSAPTPITRKVFMLNMIKYVYNKIDHKIKINKQLNITFLFFRRNQPQTNVHLSVCKRSFKIVQHQFTRILHRVYHFELLLDEEINDDFLRDVIESIAHYYNSRYPGDVCHIKMNTRWFINIVCYNYIKSLYISD